MRMESGLRPEREAGKKRLIHMPKTPIDLPAVILAKLEAAGKQGLQTSKMPDSKKQRGTVLAQLEAERKIGNLGSKKSGRYVLTEYFKPLELAAEHIEALATPGKATVFTLSKLQQKTGGAVKEQIQKAINILTKEKKLILVKVGQTNYWIHAASLRPLLTEEMESFPPEGPESVMSSDLGPAYERAKEKEGFPDVLISALLKESGLTVARLHEELPRLARSGKAVLSLGDYSLSDEEERAAALRLDGRTYLRVRLLP